ncbi:inosine/xanthosine triphosphatase [Vibrio mangrovi]|uniref:Inosine/xanthosine triphosphatase n=1 Tax=Vibrio mangrovi TaxID=474394 RepID=A0A1Y6IY29_9VIBR|nr:inosine/xanthosine triphosphatase [Vibrio mangrovi]MDW6003149.1 inosine/xanthosine triphosphatase [Vibrio mangrovi]SMS01392.1 Non-canonical purine NTP phosphatase [Vibrio mangrovi]
MSRIIVASLNPVKLKAVENAFQEVFPEHQSEVVGISVASGVSEQPMSDSETRLGALNRVSNARKEIPGADFYVGLEAGIENGFTYAWMVIESEQKRGESRSSSLILPPEVVIQLNADTELGNVMDELFQTQNIKQQGGAIGLLTNHLLTRCSVYHQALILALVPFANPTLYPDNIITAR